MYRAASPPPPCCSRGAPTGAFLAAKPPPPVLLLPAQPGAPDPLLWPGVHGPGPGPVSLAPRPHPPRGCRERIGVGTAPWLRRCFLGSCLQHLRSGEPQGRLTDRLGGFRSGRWSALGPSEPCRSWALRGSSCGLPASTEPRGGGQAARGLLHLPGAQRAPSRATRGEKGLKGRAEDAHARRGAWGGKMLSPPQSTRNFSAALRMESK